MKGEESDALSKKRENIIHVKTSSQHRTLRLVESSENGSYLSGRKQTWKSRKEDMQQTVGRKEIKKLKIKEAQEDTLATSTQNLLIQNSVHYNLLEILISLRKSKMEYRSTTLNIILKEFA